MTLRTQHDEILIQVLSRVAPELNVVNLEVPHAPAHLAAPVVSREHLAGAEPRSFSGQVSTVAFSAECSSRNSPIHEQQEFPSLLLGQESIVMR